MSNDKVKVSLKLEDIPMIIETTEELLQENKQLQERINKAIDSYENRNKYKKKRFYNGLNVGDLMYEILKGENNE